MNILRLAVKVNNQDLREYKTVLIKLNVKTIYITLIN